MEQGGEKKHVGLHVGTVKASYWLKDYHQKVIIHSQLNLVTAMSPQSDQVTLTVNPAWIREEGAGETGSLATFFII